MNRWDASLAAGMICCLRNMIYWLMANRTCSSQSGERFIYLQQLELFDDFQGGGDAVRGGGDNAAGIARAFTDGPEPADIFSFSKRIPVDADGGRRTGFRTGQDRVRTGETGQLRVHGTNAFLQILDHPGRQYSPQISGNNTGTVGGENIPETGRFPALQEVADPLGRRDKLTAACPESSFLDAPLQDETGQGMVIPEIFRTNAYQQGRVAVLTVTGMITHTVGHYAAGLGSGRDDLAARTHAEGIDAPAIRGMADQFVGCGTEGRMTRKGTILGFIDKNAGMFDPNTHGEGLLLHTQSLGEKLLDSITGRMADAQENRIRQEFPAFSVMGKDCSLHMTAPEDQFFQSGLKKDGASEPDDLLPDGRDNPFQAVCANVGLLVDEDGFRRSMGNESVQDIPDMGALYPACQFPVRKGSGSAFTELDIRIRVQDAILLHGGNIVAAGIHGFTALDQRGCHTGTGKGQGSEKTGGASTHNKRLCRLPTA